MDQSWYIIEKNKRRGPFTLKDLNQLWGLGDINSQTQLAHASFKIEGRVAQVFWIKQKVGPPPLPWENAQASSYLTPNHGLKTQGALVHHFKSLLVGSILTFFVSASFSYFRNYQKQNLWTRPTHLTLEQYKRATKPFSVEEPQFRLALGVKKQNIYFYSNLKGKKDILVRLKSLKNKTLGPRTIAFEAMGKLNRGFSHFNQFSFNEGSKIYDGAYFVEVFDVHKNVLISSKNVFLSRGSIEKFKTQLTKVNRLKGNTDLSFTLNFREKKKTLLALIEAMKDQVDTKEKNDFKKYYKSQVGPMFTTLTLGHYRQGQDLGQSPVSDHKKYQDLHDHVDMIGKKLGVVVERFLSSNQPDAKELFFDELTLLKGFIKNSKI